MFKQWTTNIKTLQKIRTIINLFAGVICGYGTVDLILAILHGL